MSSEPESSKRSKGGNFYGRRSLVDPCLEEKEMAAFCRTVNGGGAKICNDYDLNWMKCKEFWEKIKEDRTRAGIQPALPPPDEREKIMKAKFGE